MSEFLIIGGGIIGLLTARRLQQQGASVSLIDAGALGQEASWAGGGIISPLYPWRYPDFISELAQQSQLLYPILCEQLYVETGIDSELQKSGMLMLDAQEIIPANTWAAQYGVNLQIQSQQQVKIRQPQLGIDVKALWMPEVMQVRNPRLLKALIASLKKTSVKLYEKQPVLKINAKDNVIKSVNTAESTFYAENVIITAGAWSGQLVPHISVPIIPVKGQMLAFQAPQKMLDNMLLYHNHYLIPRQDNLIIAGSTMEYQAGYNKTPTKTARDELYQAAITLLPCLQHYPVVAQWSGLRPFNPEGVPFIGRLTPFKNLYMNAGHFRNGLVLAPAAVEYFMTYLKFRPYGEYQSDGL